MECSVVFWFANILVAVSASVTYCGARMCGNTDSHTFCQYLPVPSQDCAGYVKTDLNQEEKSRILTRLNTRRNDVAAGRSRGLPTAGNMLKLHWVEELSREAQRWADQCRPPCSPEEKDACRDLYSITVGQSVASVVGEAPGLRVESLVDMWYMQSIRYKGNPSYYVPSSSNTNDYSDFAQLLWAQTYMVGCGRSKFMTEWKGRFRSVNRLVCNFAPRGPPARYPLWSASKPASLCPPHTVPDSTFPALCSFQKYTSINDLPTEQYLLMDTVFEIENNKTLNYLGSLDEIYLARIAIPTMQTDLTTSNYSMQRRAITEVPETYINNIKIERNSVTAKLETNSFMPKLETTPVKHTTIKKKAELIGRPKPYNIEELNNEQEDFESKIKTTDFSIHNTVTKTNRMFANHARRNRNLKGRQDNDIYSEYDSPKMADAPKFSIIDKDKNKIMDDQLKKNLYLKHKSKEVDKEIAQPYLSYNVENEVVLTTFVVLLSSTLSDNNGSEASSDNIEDLLTDPDTVREFQKALDSIESSIFEQQTPEMVTQELMKTTTELFLSDINPEGAFPLLNQLENIYQLNGSEDRSPMYNMVMKYMPSLKDYNE